MRTRTQLNTATADALAEVQGYRGSPLYVAFIKLLDSIDDQHLETLVDARPEAAPKVQGAISQVRALRKSLLGDFKTSPIG